MVHIPSFLPKCRPFAHTSPGFSLSFGIFQNYYAHVPEFADSSLIPFVGSIATGIAFLGAPFMTPVVKRYPKYQVYMIVSVLIV
jgi:hypothetical protein